MKKIINISLAMLAISSQGCATPNRHSNEYKGKIIEFKAGVNGFDTRTFFYEGEHEVIAFDAQFTPELAKQSIAKLRTVTDKPISWLVITHPNPDKYNGASVFQEAGTRIVASKNTAESIPSVHKYKEYFFVELAKMFKKGEYPQPIAIDQIFEGTMDLVLRGGERIQLLELSKPGVSSTQTVAYVESLSSLFVGDLIHNRAHAWLEGGIVNGKPIPTISGWISDLRELQLKFPSKTIVYGGRGVSAPIQQAVANQIHYLEVAINIIDSFLIKLGNGVTALSGPDSGALYKALSAEFSSKFPEYELPYMIEFGAYGLVQARLAKKL